VTYYYSDAKEHTIKNIIRESEKDNVNKTLKIYAEKYAFHEKTLNMSNDF